VLEFVPRFGTKWLFQGSWPMDYWEQFLYKWWEYEANKFPRPPLDTIRLTCQFIPLLANQSHCCENFIAQSATVKTESTLRSCLKPPFAFSLFSDRRIWHFHSLMELTDLLKSYRKSSCCSLLYLDDESSFIFSSTD